MSFQQNFPRVKADLGKLWKNLNMQKEFIKEFNGGFRHEVETIAKKQYHWSQFLNISK